MKVKGTSSRPISSLEPISKPAPKKSLTKQSNQNKFTTPTPQLPSADATVAKKGIHRSAQTPLTSAPNIPQIGSNTETVGLANPLAAANTAAPQTAEASPSRLDQLLKAQPDLKSNQDLINHFYKSGDNTWGTAASKAKEHGLDLNQLVQNRSGAITTPTPTAATTPTTTTAAPTNMDQLLKEQPDLKSNQDLINHFYKSSGNTWDGAASKAKEYGVDLGQLVQNRSGAIGSTAAPDQTGGAAPPDQTGGAAPPDQTGGAAPPTATTGNDQIGRVIGMENTTPAFRQKVSEIAGRLKMDPTHLMAVMSFESGGSFSPSKRNAAGSGATGLIQFMPSTARHLGTSTSKLAQMSPMKQLDYVEKYLKPYAGKMNSVEDAYMAVLMPNAIGKGPNHALFRNSGSRRKRHAYKQNAGLDSNHNGIVTVREAARKVRARIL